MRISVAQSKTQLPCDLNLIQTVKCDCVVYI